MPDSVEMPAPVKTTVRAEPARRAARREIADMAALCGVPKTRGTHIPFNNSKLAESGHGGILAHHFRQNALEPPEAFPINVMGVSQDISKGVAAADGGV